MEDFGTVVFEDLLFVDDVFNRAEKLGIYMKVYNFGGDENSRKPEGQVQYELVKKGSNEKIFDFTEDVSGTSTQVTVEKLLPLKNLAPGQYTLRLKVTDKTRNQTLTPSAQFTVT